MQNISIINQKINSVYSAHKFINKAKKQRLAFYYENLERVNNLDAQYISIREIKLY
jgi:cell shape-determining protein MreC